MARTRTSKSGTKRSSLAASEVAEILQSGGYTLTELRDSLKDLPRDVAAEIRRAIAKLTPGERASLDRPQPVAAPLRVVENGVMVVPGTGSKGRARTPARTTGSRLFADLMCALRGNMTMVAFSKKLGLSYTFTREMTRGNRFPSDDALVEIAKRCRVPVRELVLAAYWDRSELLREGMRKRGMVPKGVRSTAR